VLFIAPNFTHSRHECSVAELCNSTETWLHTLIHSVDDSAIRRQHIGNRLFNLFCLATWPHHGKCFKQKLKTLTNKQTNSRDYQKKNRPSQQLFKAFIVFYTSTATCFGLHWPSSSGTHNIIYKKKLLYILYCVYYLMMVSEGRNM
jgi:hypothetical protein